MTTSIDRRTTALCECGCGQTPPLAVQTDRRFGWVKGRPKRWVHGHNASQARQSRGHTRMNEKPATGPKVTRRCARCTWPLSAHDVPAPRGFRAYQARGLCAICFDHVGPEGRIDFERLTRSRDEVLDQYDELRCSGFGRRDAATLIGISRIALERHIFRGRRDGDPRAVLGRL